MTNGNLDNIEKKRSLLEDREAILSVMLICVRSLKWYTDKEMLKNKIKIFGEMIKKIDDKLKVL